SRIRAAVGQPTLRARRLLLSTQPRQLLPIRPISPSVLEAASHSVQSPRATPLLPSDGRSLQTEDHSPTSLARQALFSHSTRSHSPRTATNTAPCSQTLAARQSPRQPPSL